MKLWLIVSMWIVCVAGGFLGLQCNACQYKHYDNGYLNALVNRASIVEINFLCKGTAKLVQLP